MSAHDPLQVASTVAASYAEALRRHDAAALAALYAPQVLVLDAFLPEPSRSAAAWEANIRAWFAGLEPDAVTVAEFNLTAVGADGEVVCAAGTVRYRDQLPDGSERNSVTNRLSWVLQRSGDRWLIVHEHTSVAVDLDAGAPIFP